MSGHVAGVARGTAGDPLVFLHGIGGGHAAWEPQLAAFSGRFRCIAWDMPGYGASDPLPEMTFPALAGALAQLLDEHGISAARVVGHSMGGMVAQEFAATRPERLLSLTLSGTSPAFGRPDGDWQRRFIAERLGPLDAGGDMAALAPALVAELVGDAPDADGVAAAVTCMAAVPAATYRAAMHCLIAFDQRAALARIAVPTLVIAGGKDTNATPTVMEGMAARIPGARYVCLAGAGHIANLEQPAAFNAALAAFLAEAQQRGPGAS